MGRAGGLRDDAKCDDMPGDPGRDHPGMVGDIISERWRHHSGIVGGFLLESAIATSANGASELHQSPEA
jgi:hypothetical protein